MDAETTRRLLGLEEEVRRLGSFSARKPSIANVRIIDANTEYSHMLPKGCKKFTLHVRDGTAIRVSFRSGVVAKPNPGYWTLKANTSWSEDNLDIEGDIWLYFACTSTNKVVELILWS